MTGFYRTEYREKICDSYGGIAREQPGIVVYDFIVNGNLRVFRIGIDTQRQLRL
jgi:hypothetical protein